MLGRRFVNTSPLVFLALVGLLKMLREGATEVVVPEAVLLEVPAHGPDDPIMSNSEVRVPEQLRRIEEELHRRGLTEKTY